MGHYLNGHLEKTLDKKGADLDRDLLEREADITGLSLLINAGYDPYAAVDALAKKKAELEPEWQSQMIPRIKQLQETLQKQSPPKKHRSNSSLKEVQNAVLKCIAESESIPGHRKQTTESTLERVKRFFIGEPHN